MFAYVLRLCRTLLLPVLVPACAAAAVLWLTDGRPGASVHLLPVAVGIFVMLLGLRFNRSRIVLAALVLMLVQTALMVIHQMGGEPPMGGLFIMAALAAPVLLAIIALFQERGFFTLIGMARFALVAGLVVFVWCVIAIAQRGEGPGEAGPPLAGVLPMGSAADVELNWPIWLALLTMVAVHAFRVARRRDTLDAGLLGAGVALWLAIVAASKGYGAADDGNAQSLSQAASVWLGAGTLMLMLAMLEASFAMAFRDELTGLPARRALREAMLKLPATYAIAMVDIDHFKKLNDKHGHDVGDQVLRRVAQQLGKVGGGGYAFRYGGEEFAILFPGRDVAEVMPTLDALREVVAATPFMLRSKGRPRSEKKGAPKRGKPAARDGQVNVTVSIGVAHRDDRADTPDEVMQAADKALYRAKKGGRNQVKK